MLNVGLYIPCYIEQFYPEVGMATVRLLEKLGVRVIYPEDQTCCGQPQSNSGLADAIAPLAKHWLALFKDFDYVVAPSGSCVAMVRKHYEPILGGVAGFDRVRSHTYELCEFLVDVLEIERIEGRFPHKVGIHQSCHGLRELRLGSGTERMVAPFDKVKTLLSSLEGIELVELRRPDECCGFGGTFAVAEEAISCMMGRDRLTDHQNAGAEVITGVDMSCLMHLSGLARREARPLRFMHVSEIMAGEEGRA